MHSTITCKLKSSKKVFQYSFNPKIMRSNNDSNMIYLPSLSDFREPRPACHVTSWFYAKKANLSRDAQLAENGRG